MFNTLSNTREKMRASRERRQYQKQIRWLLREIHGYSPGEGEVSLELEENLFVCFRESSYPSYGYSISLLNADHQRLGCLTEVAGYQMALNLGLEARLQQMAETAVAEREQTKLEREHALAEQREELLA